MNTVSLCVAYLDANSGTMLLQIVLGGLGGLFVFARLFWHRIRRSFSARRGNPGAQEADGATDQLQMPEQPAAQAQKRAA